MPGSATRSGHRAPAALWPRRWRRPAACLLTAHRPSASAAHLQRWRFQARQHLERASRSTTRGAQVLAASAPRSSGQSQRRWLSSLWCLGYPAGLATQARGARTRRARCAMHGSAAACPGLRPPPLTPRRPGRLRHSGRSGCALGRGARPRRRSGGGAVLLWLGARPRRAERRGSPTSRRRLTRLARNRCPLLALRTTWPCWPRRMAAAGDAGLATADEALRRRATAAGARAIRGRAAPAARRVLLAAGGTCVRGRGCFGAALATAPAARAPVWGAARRRLARPSLGRAGRPRRGPDLLAPVYGWFTEGFDTPDLRDARALLDALQ